MKSRFVSFGVISFFLLTFIAASLSYAEQAMTGKECKMERRGAMGHKEGMGPIILHKADMMLDNAAELGLSAEQVADIEKLKLETEKSSIMRKAEIDVIALDIKAKLKEDPINTVALSDLIDKKYDLKKSMAKSEVEALVNLKNILTAEQKAKFEAMHKQAEEK